MRIQFASIEASLCAYVVILSVGILSSTLSVYSSQQYHSIEALRLGFAEHDFMAEADGNASLQTCITEYLTNSSPCISTYELAYTTAYNLPSFSVSIPADYVINDSCFPAPDNRSVICLGD